MRSQFLLNGRWRYSIVLVIFIWLYLYFKPSHRQWVAAKLFTPDYNNDPNLANSTLGFQHIIAISAEDPSDPSAWRLNGLVGAANMTGLLIELENTTRIDEGEVTRIMEASKGRASRGSAQAWAAHARVLNRVLEEKATTTLIVEDDIDWDVKIRTLLGPKQPIASTIRQISETSSELDPYQWPYGNSFDILWIGHCGCSSMGKPRLNMSIPDNEVLPKDQIVNFGGDVELEDMHRQIQFIASIWCTFAYAVTWQGAEKLLKWLERGGEAFDIELMVACQTGSLRCLAVNPEIMHQQRMIGLESSLIHKINNDGKGSSVDEQQTKEATPEQETKPRPVTFNIKHSARCNVGVDPSMLRQCLPTSEDKKKFSG